jgi:MPBQ/MSBQ methyltransferase
MTSSSHNGENEIATLEFPYCYYADITDTQGVFDYFHYGFWAQGTESPKEAQEKLWRLMFSLIPKGVKRILDAGCGLEKTTFDLTQAGYSAIGISPDKANMELARTRHGEGVQLITTSFEDYSDELPFDLILFQESSQYVALWNLIIHSRELLRKNGYLLICDEIRYGEKKSRNFHRKDLLLNMAGAAGFKLLVNRDITDQVMPTRHYVVNQLVDNRDRIIESFRPFRENVVEEIDRLTKGWKDDSDLFSMRFFGYEIFLFQKRQGPYQIGCASLLFMLTILLYSRRAVARIERLNSRS